MREMYPGITGKYYGIKVVEQGGANKESDAVDGRG